MKIRLVDLARATGVDHQTAIRWAATGLVTTTNTGRGNGHGNFCSRSEAIEFCALAALRRAGVPLQELRRIARKLRLEGRSGPAFLALGADGRTLLLDGAGDDSPLRDAYTGQGRLFVQLDLRRLRRDIERLVTDMQKAPRGDHAAAT